ncbi:hypothetical protein [Cellulomonas septica]|uniref:FtsX-like permease family protein n=1 Tax=Cellulomonas septica TaxID=285080 RepID=A0ABX1JWF1_9CELL|nr:hypothetical protein [Cellulomonas septica]NKY38115.1 hypothetical protein [Cellulomonas septica]
MTQTQVRARSWTSVGRRWRASASFGEGLANVRDGALLFAGVVAISTLVVGGALVADVVTGARILAAEREYLDSGGNLLVVQRQSEGKLDAGLCASLEAVPGVTAAAGVSVEPGAVRLVGRPESQQTIVTATAGVLDILGVDGVGGDEVVASTVVSERWLWQEGSRLRIEAEDADHVGAPSAVLTVAAVSNLERLSEGASTGILLLQAPTGEVDHCFVQVDAQYREDVRAALPALLGERPDSAVAVSDRLPAGAFAQDPVAAWDGRPTRWIAGAAGAVVGLLWLVVAWTRRGRAALYASLGVPYAGGVLIRWVEGASVAVLGVLWGAALAASVAVAAVDTPLGVALSSVTRGGALAGAVGLAVVTVAALVRPGTLAALKDR